MANNQVAQLIIGEASSISLRLLKDGQRFDMSTASSVQIALVDQGHNNIILDPITITSGQTGNDWANSLIVIDFTAVQTGAINQQTTYLFEIQVIDQGITNTWFVPVRAIRGLIT